MTLVHKKNTTVFWSFGLLPSKCIDHGRENESSFLSMFQLRMESIFSTQKKTIIAYGIRSCTNKIKPPEHLYVI